MRVNYLPTIQMNEKQMLELFLPDGCLKWFDVIDAKKTEDSIDIILEEKNIPPPSPEIKERRIVSKGFTDIHIDDFPIRGRKVNLLFRRRYWQVTGMKKLLKRKINFCAEGTKLEKEFADFLKEVDRKCPR